MSNDVDLVEASAFNDFILKQPYFSENRKEVAKKTFNKACEFIKSHYSNIDEEEPTGESKEIPEHSMENNKDSTLQKLSEILANQQQAQME